MIKCYTYNNGIFMEDTKLQNESIIELISPSQGEIESTAKFLQRFKIGEYEIKALIDGDFDKIKIQDSWSNYITMARFNDSLNAMIIEDEHILLCHDKKDGAPKDLMQVVQGIWSSVKIPGYLNLDVADINSIISSTKNIYAGVGSGKGENKRNAVANTVSASPELADALKYTSGVIVNTIVSPSITLDDLDANMAQLQKLTKPDANIIFSVSFDGELDDEIIANITASR